MRSPAAFHFALAGLLLTGVLCASASAQTTADPTERAPLQLGPLGLAPRIALTDLGVDTNVFNEYVAPRQDFTFTLSPMLDTSLRAGRSRLNVFTRADLVYFQKYSAERSLDGAVDSRFEVRGNRFTPWLTAAIESGRQRWGYEIDLRFRRVTTGFGGGVGVRLGSRTRAGMTARHHTYKHEPDVEFFGSNLSVLLDRQTLAVGTDLRYALTPLTTAIVSVERGRDRFEFTPSRDANSWRVDTGLDLAPTALIAGRGRVGYRRLVGVGGDFPTFSGVVASVAATSRIRGRVRIDATTSRDVDYSWEVTYPYYVLTGVTLVITPQLTPHWDVRGRAGVQRLAYLAGIGVPTPVDDRVDRLEMSGAGVGYRIGRDVRLGIDVDHERRQSPVQLRAYRGYRTGLSVIYGR